MESYNGGNNVDDHNKIVYLYAGFSRQGPVTMLALVVVADETVH
jgi:hypothetical protein